MPPETLLHLLQLELDRRGDFPTPAPLDPTPEQECRAWEFDAEKAHESLLRVQGRIAGVRFYRQRLAELKEALGV